MLGPQTTMKDAIDFTKGDGLVPVIVQEDGSGAVLMLAYMNRQAFEQTLASGYATYWSRSRQSLWAKGETSGNRQRVRAVHMDCDGDTVLLRVVQEGGAACHEGYHTCFFRRRDGDRWTLVESRVVDPDTLYKKS